MAPKAATKKSAAPSSHGSYQDMIKDAIIKLKERNGSSRQAIKKYIKANNNLGATTDNAFSSHISKALKTGVDNGVFAQPKGASGPVKLNKPGTAEKKPAAAKPKTEKKEAKPKATTAKKAAPKKTTTAKKPAAKKAAAPKKEAKPKAATAKKAAKPKAAPAVVEEKPKVLGKTKTGRVVKTTKPQTAKAVAPKKAAAKKATPKKSTPKKA